MKNDDVLAVVVGDLHLTHLTPVARAEKDWYEVQAKYLKQVREALYQNPHAVAVYVGDIFDKGWDPKKCPPELINFALDHLPRGFAIPGQHDLPHHRYEDIHKSAYQILCTAKILHNLPPGKAVQSYSGSGLFLYGFPWGFPPQSVSPAKKAETKGLHVAVCHKYIWSSSYTGYPGAKEEAKVTALAADLADYQIAVFGDNHIPFTETVVTERFAPGDRMTRVVNCGTFMRRKADEAKIVPRLTFIHANGLLSYQLMEGEDEFSDDKDVKVSEAIANFGDSTREFMASLAKLGQSSLDFIDAVRRHMDNSNVPDEVRSIITEAMEE